MSFRRGTVMSERILKVNYNDFFLNGPFNNTIDQLRSCRTNWFFGQEEGKLMLAGEPIRLQGSRYIYNIYCSFTI